MGNKNFRFRLSLLVALLTLPLPCITGTINRHISLNFLESDYTLQQNAEDQIEIRPHNLAMFPEGENPGLPLLTVNVAVEAGSRFVNAEVTASRRLILSDVVMANSPKSVSMDMMGRSVEPDTIINYPSGIYPENNFSHTVTSSWDNASIQHCLACPFVYDTEGGNLYFIDSMEIDLTLDDGHDIAVLSDSPDSFTCRPGHLDEGLLKYLVVNTDEADEIIAAAPAPMAMDTGDRVDYVIITSEKLKPTFQRLINWKRTKGLFSKIITIEEIDEQYTETDDDLPLKIKKCLFELYNNHGLKYALLGGDDTVVPVRSCYFSYQKYVDNFYNRCYVPADLYYSTYINDFNWNNNLNEDYGQEDDDISYHPQVILSRLPLREPHEAYSIIDKILEYEQHPKWSNSMLSCGMRLEDNFVTDPEGWSDSQFYANKIYEEAIGPYWGGVYHKFFDTGTDFEGGKDYELNAEHLSDKWASGYNFMQFLTHGGQYLYLMENIEDYKNGNPVLGKYTTEYSDVQSNACHTIVTTTACYTNAFDNQIQIGEVTLNHHPCLSESLLRNPDSGVVAYWGSSRASYYNAREWTLGASAQYEVQFYKHLFSENTGSKCFGAITTAAKLAMLATITESSFRELQLSLIASGDPEMPVFISTPKVFESSSVEIKGGEVCVSSGCEGSKICVSSYRNPYNVYHETGETEMNVPVADLPEGEVTVCITKDGFIPKIYTLMLEPDYDTLTIQNQTLKGDSEYSSDIIRIGSKIDPDKAEGAVVVEDGRTVLMGKEIRISPEMIVKKRAELIISVEHGEEN